MDRKNKKKVGAIIIGDLNPVSIIEYNGGWVYSKAMAGFIDVSRLFRYEAMKERIKKFL